MQIITENLLQLTFENFCASHFCWRKKAIPEKIKFSEQKLFKKYHPFWHCQASPNSLNAKNPSPVNIYIYQSCKSVIFLNFIFSIHVIFISVSVMLFCRANTHCWFNWLWHVLYILMVPLKCLTELWPYLSSIFNFVFAPPSTLHSECHFLLQTILSPELLSDYWIIHTWYLSLFTPKTAMFDVIQTIGNVYTAYIYSIYTLCYRSQVVYVIYIYL